MVLPALDQSAPEPDVPQAGWRRHVHRYGGDTRSLGLAAVVLVHELAEVVVIANGVRAGRAQGLTPPSAAAPSPEYAMTVVA